MMITLVDTLNGKEEEVSFSDAMRRLGLSFENTKYHTTTGQLIDGRYYLVGLGGNPIPPDDCWKRR